MNPFLFKAHPLLALTIQVLTDPGGQTLQRSALLLLFYLAGNLVWAAALALILRELVHLRPRAMTLYWMALPALVGYLPILLTLLGDVLEHAFRFGERFILVFSLLIVASMLGMLYGFLIRHPRSGQPVGLMAGFSIALAMLLVSLPLAVGLLKTDLLAILG